MGSVHANLPADTDMYEFSVNVKVVAAPESEDDMEGMYRLYKTASR